MTRLLFARSKVETVIINNDDDGQEQEKVVEPLLASLLQRAINIAEIKSLVNQLVDDAVSRGLRLESIKVCQPIINLAIKQATKPAKSQVWQMCKSIVQEVVRKLPLRELRMTYTELSAAVTEIERRMKRTHSDSVVKIRAPQVSCTATRPTGSLLKSKGQVKATVQNDTADSGDEDKNEYYNDFYGLDNNTESGDSCDLALDPYIPDESINMEDLSRHLTPELLDEALDSLENDYDYNPYVFVCAMCPRTTWKLNNTQYNYYMEHLAERATHVDALVNHMHTVKLSSNPKDRLMKMVDSYDKRHSTCSHLLHPNTFYDEAWMEMPEEFPVPNMESLTLAAVNSILERAMADINTCTCEPIPHQHCPRCKYFFYTMSVVMHSFHNSFKNNVKILMDVSSAFQQYYLQDCFAKTSGPLCPACRLPCTDAELRERPEANKDFPPCDQSSRSDAMFAQVIEQCFNFDHMDTMVHHMFTSSLQDWCAPHKINVRKAHGAGGMSFFRHTKKVILQAIRLGHPLSNLSHVYNNLFSLLLVKPSYSFEEGSGRPLNAVISIHRTNMLVQHLLFNIMPCIVIEHCSKEEKNPSGAQKRKQILHTRRTKALCDSMISTVTTVSQLVTEISDATSKLDSLEVMANIHRFNNTRHLSNYQKAFRERNFLIYVWGCALKVIPPMADLIRLSPCSTKEDVMTFTYMESLNMWLLRRHSEFVSLRNEIISALDASHTRHESVKHSELAFTLYSLKKGCTFCGVLPHKKITNMCGGCKVARYCSQACYDKYVDLHKLVCAREDDAIVDKFSELEHQDLEYHVINQNRKIRRSDEEAKPKKEKVKKKATKKHKGASTSEVKKSDVVDDAVLKAEKAMLELIAEEERNKKEKQHVKSKNRRKK